jgi:hypothetical protein
MEGPLRVVLVRRRSAEGGHHRVADELLDRAARAVDLGSHRVVEAVEHRPRALGILSTPELRGADEIRKENRHEFALLGRHSDLHAHRAVSTVRRPARPRAVSRTPFEREIHRCHVLQDARSAAAVVQFRWGLSRA